MKFKSSKKRKIFLLSFILIILIGIMGVTSNAFALDTVYVGYNDTETTICLDISDGSYVSSYDGEYLDCDGYLPLTVKMLGDNYAHCVNWSKDFVPRDDYAKDTSWDSKSKDAIIGGYLIRYLEKQDFGSFERAYVKIGAALNTYFAEYISDSDSYSYSSNSEIMGYIDSANKYYNDVKLTNLPAISLNTSNNSLSYNATDSKYFSSKITVSGLVSSYGGDATTYKITATASNGEKINICSDSKGTKCNTSVTVPSDSTSYSFYVFADENKVSSGDTININVTGSNKSVYYTSSLYYVPGDDYMQKVLVADDFSYPRSVSGSITLTIPDLTIHRIYAHKIDESGNRLNGATLEIYKDDPTKSENLLISNDGKSDNVIYVSDKSVEKDDDFFNHDYYLVEKSAPDGYIYSSVNKFYIKGTSTDMGMTCYYNGGTENEESVKVDDLEFCYPENYVYKCQNSETNEVLDLNESGNCEFEVAVESNQGNDKTESEDDTLESEKKIVTYNTICYNKAKNEVANDSYCNNKGSYTKVYHSEGNITVKHVNSKNVVKISKKDITGDDEISGANLKICKEADYVKDKDKCAPAKTVDNIVMSWVSGSKAHSIYGVPVGKYYIVEVTPPKGYIRATIATLFSIDASGAVKTGDKTITNADFIKSNSSIVVNNELSKITISKTDMATSKELPGATISICRTYLDENNERQLLVDQNTGDCIATVLADGTEATWISTNSPKIIEGLQAGTYYLVEKQAPKNYTTAESILFTLKEDGTLVDANGKSLASNKIVMKDKPIKDVGTGSLDIYLVVGILGIVSVLGIIGYFYYRKSKGSKK